MGVDSLAQWLEFGLLTNGPGVWSSFEGNHYQLRFIPSLWLSCHKKYRQVPTTYIFGGGISDEYLHYVTYNL